MSLFDIRCLCLLRSPIQNENATVVLSDGHAVLGRCLFATPPPRARLINDFPDFPNGGPWRPAYPSVIPAVFSGNPEFFFLALHSCGFALSCRECRFALSGQTGDRVAPLTPLSFPQFLAGIQCLSLLSLHSCEFALSCRECRFALSGQTGVVSPRLPLCHSRSF